MLTSPEDIANDAQALTALIKEGKPVAEGKRLLLLIDELGAGFQEPELQITQLLPPISNR